MLLFMVRALEGFTGKFTKRTGAFPDGCAIFYAKNTFEEVGFQEIKYNHRCEGLDRDNVGMRFLASLCHCPVVFQDRSCRCVI